MTALNPAEIIRLEIPFACWGPTADTVGRLHVHVSSRDPVREQ